MGSYEVHLSDGSCGRYVDVRNWPTPSSTPTVSPTIPVRVENPVQVRNSTGSNLVVSVDNWPTPGPKETVGVVSLSEEDSENLREIRKRLDRFSLTTTFALGLGLFSIAGLLVLTLPVLRS